MILNGCDSVLDDEKYFGLSSDNVHCNQRYYTTDPSTTSSDVKYKKKKEYAPKLLVWMGMSSKGTSNIYVHKSKQAITSNINVLMQGYYHLSNNITEMIILAR